MAAGGTVEIKFAGEASGFNRVVKQVAENSEESAGRMRRAFDGAGAAADSSESKFMGMADLLDGLGGAFGLPTEGATNMMRSFGDLSGGFAVLQGPIASIGGAFKALNLTMLANPVFLIVAGIAALVAILVVAYMKSETFREIVHKAFAVVKQGFDAVWGVAQAVFGWLANNWQTVLLLITGPIGLAVKYISGHWDTIMRGVGVLKDAIVGAFETAWGTIKRVLNFIAGAWNSTLGKLSVKIPDFVPGIGGKRFDMPDIPLLASGGIVTKPTLAVLGEAGPEAVVPLGRGGGVAPNVVNLYNYAPLTDRGAADHLVRLLEDYFRRGGEIQGPGSRTLKPT